MSMVDLRPMQGAFGYSGLGAGFGAPSRSVFAIQRDLNAVGFGLRSTGVVDSPTVMAINSIFRDWDDVPPPFRTGRLTARQINSQIVAVARYVRKAVRGSTGYDRLPDGGVQGAMFGRVASSVKGKIRALQTLIQQVVAANPQNWTTLTERIPAVRVTGRIDPATLEAANVLLAWDRVQPVNAATLMTYIDMLLRDHIQPLVNSMLHPYPYKPYVYRGPDENDEFTPWMPGLDEERRARTYRGPAVPNDGTPMPPPEARRARKYRGPVE